MYATRGVSNSTNGRSLMLPQELTYRRRDMNVGGVHHRQVQTRLGGLGPWLRRTAATIEKDGTAYDRSQGQHAMVRMGDPRAERTNIVGKACDVRLGRCGGGAGPESESLLDDRELGPLGPSIVVCRLHVRFPVVAVSAR